MKEIRAFAAILQPTETLSKLSHCLHTAQAAASIGHRLPRKNGDLQVKHRNRKICWLSIPAVSTPVVHHRSGFGVLPGCAIFQECVHRVAREGTREVVPLRQVTSHRLQPFELACPLHPFSPSSLARRPREF